MQILLLLLAGYVLDQSPDLDTALDVVLSLILLAITAAALAVFLYHALLYIKAKARSNQLKRLKTEMQELRLTKQGGGLSVSAMHDGAPDSSTAGKASISVSSNNGGSPSNEIELARE